MINRCFTGILCFPLLQQSRLYLGVYPEQSLHHGCLAVSSQPFHPVPYATRCHSGPRRSSCPGLVGSYATWMKTWIYHQQHGHGPTNLQVFFAETRFSHACCQKDMFWLKKIRYFGVLGIIYDFIDCLSKPFMICCGVMTLSRNSENMW